jgi:hypothetical protein
MGWMVDESTEAEVDNGLFASGMEAEGTFLSRRRLWEQVGLGKGVLVYQVRVTVFGRQLEN